MVVTSILKAHGSDLYRQLLQFVRDTIELVKQDAQGLSDASRHQALCGQFGSETGYTGGDNT